MSNDCVLTAGARGLQLVEEAHRVHRERRGVPVQIEHSWDQLASQGALISADPSVFPPLTQVFTNVVRPIVKYKVSNKRLR